MTFRVGQKVVCVVAGHSCCLQVEQIYTCLAVNPEFLQVDCCSRPDHQDHCGWMKKRFRPVVECKTDISIFTAMLNPSKVDA